MYKKLTVNVAITARFFTISRLGNETLGAVMIRETLDLSTAVGIIFGPYSACRVANMDPIEFLLPQ